MNFSNSYQGNWNPYSAAVGGLPVRRKYMNPNNYAPSYGSLIQQQQQHFAYDYAQKYSSNPIASTQYALDGTTALQPTSASQPYRKPNDYYNAMNYLSGTSTNIANIYANNVQYESLMDSLKNDLRVLQPLGIYLKLNNYQNSSGYADVLRTFLDLTWWSLQGPLDKAKTQYKQQLVNYLQQLGGSGSGLNEVEFKSFFSKLFKDAALAMGYTRVQVFEDSILKFLNSVIALSVGFDDLILFIANLCHVIGSTSVAVTYSILEAFFKILIATKSKKVLDVFHIFLKDLIGITNNNASNEMIGSVKTTKKIFYDAFKTLQNNVNVQNASPYFITDDGMIMYKSGGVEPTIKMTTEEQNQEAAAQGQTMPEIVEQTRDMGQIKVVV